MKATPDFAPFVEKMQAAGLSQTFIDNFQYYYTQLVEGATGYIGRAEAQPVHDLPTYATLDAACEQAGVNALAHTVVLKLNGGLGTSMGMDGPKSLLPVKEGLTFLDIIVRQNLHLRATTGARVPLLLMNSFATHAASLAALAAHADFSQDIPVDFLQHMEPKVWKDSLLPAAWPQDPEKEWCPPGHGDIYTALVTSGMLQQLLDAGYEYAFVSNADNLGASLDLRILGHFAANRIPFLMEVAERTAADRKGGHLAQRPDGQLVLRESAQCPPVEMDEFQDIGRYQYFNTNNLWLHLPSLARLLAENQGIVPLPLIRNEKPIDPTDPTSPRVYQLETAMGAAIGLFADAQALCVPRSRFLPVKKNSDLLVIMSDAYELTSDFALRLGDERHGAPPMVELDDRFYTLLSQVEERFPHGAPSLAACDELRVTGDVRFGRDVRVEGKVTIVHEDAPPLVIADHVVLTG
jgi:UTP--glucose-1-phosphate uridylyltransferase